MKSQNGGFNYIPRGVCDLNILFAGFNFVYMITTELYPTNLRSQAVGFASSIARIFCLCAPFLGPLATFWEPLPMLIIGAPILLTAALVLKLPETHNRDLPQTVKVAQEMENLP